VRASDAVLMSRMGIEFRAGQKSYDIVQTATINKMPWQMLAAYEPPDNEWLKAMLEFYGEQKSTELVRSIATSLRPVISDGHLTMVRAVGAGEYWVALNNYVNLS
jgi:hypothetical protein